MYAPDQLNSGNKANPIYRSSVAPEKDEQHQHNHHHQHDNTDHNDVDFSISNIQITPSALMSMCPALLVQIEQGLCAIDATAAPIQQPTAKKDIKDISSFGECSPPISPCLTIIVELKNTHLFTNLFVFIHCQHGLRRLYQSLSFHYVD